MAGESRINGVMRQTSQLCVLVVTDDPVSLDSLKHLLQECCYDVTTASNTSKALELLMENRGKFDVLIADVDELEKDRFQLIESLGKVLPTILLSSTNTSKDLIKIALAKGACHCFMKPVQFDDLKSIPRYIFKRKQPCDSAARNNFFLHSKDRHSSPANMDQSGRSDRKCEKRNEGRAREDGRDEHNVGPVPHKKPRLVWDDRLKKKFEKAYNELGPENAVPKKILELMNEPGLSRENIASHLQKYKESLRKAKDKPTQQFAMSTMLGSDMIIPWGANAPSESVGRGSLQFFRPNQLPMSTMLMQHGMISRPNCLASMNIPRGMTLNNIGDHQLVYSQNHCELLNNSHHPLMFHERLGASIHEAQPPLSNEACLRRFNNEFTGMDLSGISYRASFADPNLEQVRDQVRPSQEDLIRVEVESNIIKSFGQMGDQMLLQEDFARVEHENNMLMYNGPCPNFGWCDFPPKLRTPPTPGSEIALKPEWQHESVQNNANEGSNLQDNIGQSNGYLINNGLEQGGVNADINRNFLPLEGPGVENRFADGSLGTVRENHDAWHQ